MKKLLLFSAIIFASVLAEAGPKFVTPVISTVSLGGRATYYYQQTNNISFVINSSTPIVASSTGTSILGTNTNNDADTGWVGEYVSSVTAVTDFTTAGQYGDAATITLTAGDWDIGLLVNADQNGATWTGVLVGISTTAGNTTANLVNADTAITTGWGSSSTTPTFTSVTIPPRRFSISGTTTFYAKVRAAYTLGTPRHYTGLWGRRAR